MRRAANEPDEPQTVRKAAAMGALFAAFIAFAVGPQLLPSGYSMVRHSVSESAAQATEGAWLARAGLALLGASGLLLLDRMPHSRWARIGMGCFGTGLIAAAFWSHSPWLPQLPNDPVEDLLHSIASSVVGAGFINATFATMLWSHPQRIRLGSLIALVVGVAAPVLMAIDEPRAGLWQRLMFGTAMLWLVAVSSTNASGKPPREA